MKTIIIKTGFEAIIHDIQFQPTTIPKGKLLVNADHVLQVEELRKDGKSYEIKAQIIRQTSVTSPPYLTKLFVSF